MLKRVIKAAPAAHSAIESTPRRVKSRRSQSSESELDQKKKQTSRRLKRTSSDEEQKVISASEASENEAARKNKKKSASDGKSHSTKMKRTPLVDLDVIESIYSAVSGKRRKARQQLIDIFTKYDPKDEGTVPKEKFFKCLTKMNIKLKKEGETQLTNVFKKNSHKPKPKSKKDTVEIFMMDYLSFVEFVSNVRDSEKLGEIAVKMRKAIDRLNEKEEFNLLTKLTKLDVKKKKWLATETFTDFLEKNEFVSFRLRNNEVKALVERFEYEYGKKIYGIDYEQFAQWLQPLLSMDIEELHRRIQFLFARAKKNGYDTRSLFEDIDQDDSGFISGMELKEALYEMGMPLNDTQIRCLVDEYDTNNDGKIQYSEFSSLFKKDLEDEEENELEELEEEEEEEEEETEDTKSKKKTSKKKSVITTSEEVESESEKVTKKKKPKNKRNTFSWGISKAFARKKTSSKKSKKNQESSESEEESEEEENTKKIKRNKKKTKSKHTESEEDSESDARSSKKSKPKLKKKQNATESEESVSDSDVAPIKPKKGKKSSSKQQQEDDDTEEPKKKKHNSKLANQKTKKKKRKKKQPISDEEEASTSSTEVPKKKKKTKRKSVRHRNDDGDDDDDDDDDDNDDKDEESERPQTGRKERSLSSRSTKDRPTRRSSLMSTKSHRRRSSVMSRATNRRRSSVLHRRRRRRSMNSMTGGGDHHHHHHHHHHNNNNNDDSSSSSGLDAEQLRQLQSRHKRSHFNDDDDDKDQQDDRLSTFDNDNDNDDDDDDDDDDGTTKSDTEYQKQMKKALHRAFDFFDQDHSSTIDKKELGNVLRAIGENVTSMELKEIMKKVDKDKSGQIDFHEFYSLVKERIQAKGFKITERTENQIRQAFQQIDQDQNGTIDAKEFEYLIFKVLKVELSVEEQDALMDAVDTNGDGSVNIEEFMIFMRTMETLHTTTNISKRSRRCPPVGISKIAFSAMKKIARGAPLDIDANLLTFLGVPSNFRPAITSTFKVLKKNTMEHVLSFPPPQTVHCLAQSQSYNLKLLKDLETLGELQRVESSQLQAIVSLKTARGVPKPFDTREDDVIGRCVHVCLFQDAPKTTNTSTRTGTMTSKSSVLQHQSTRSSSSRQNGTVIGNVHTIPVYWNEKEEDVWEFSKKATKDDKYKFLVRTNANNEDLFLLIEFIVRLQTGHTNSKHKKQKKDQKKQKEQVEMVCCWCKIPIRTLLAKRSDVYRTQEKLFGGTAFSPLEIEEEEISRRRTGWRMVTNALSTTNNKQNFCPSVGIKSVPLDQFNEEMKNHIRFMPPTILAPFASIPILFEYMMYMCDVLSSVSSASSVITCEPALKLLPKIIEDHDAITVFRKLFDLEMKNLKTKEEKMNKFQELVLRMWPSFVQLQDALPKAVMHVTATTTAPLTKSFSTMTIGNNNGSTSTTTTTTSTASTVFNQEARLKFLECTAQGKVRLKDIQTACVPFHVREVAFERLL